MSLDLATSASASVSAPVFSPPQAPAPPDPTIEILDVPIVDVTLDRAVAIVEAMLQAGDGRCRRVYFVNAHTLNLAVGDRGYRAILRAADCVFGDGAGVRWAARMRGRRLAGNVNGTDLIPELFAQTAGRGYRYFLIGGRDDAIRRAADHARRAFPGWTLAGFHHGYLTPDLDREAMQAIRAARPHLLLVGQGNPLQERWIDAHADRLGVPAAMGVGGLFSYWSGDLRRAPAWLRRRGAEWLGILWQQRSKARRYLLGNPLFLWRSWRDARRR